MKIQRNGYLTQELFDVLPPKKRQVNLTPAAIEVITRKRLNLNLRIIE